MADFTGVLGVDTGGTFTDFYWYSDGQARTHKVLSTPHSPERAIVQGIAELGLGEAVAAGRVAIVHGSTVATNAALEGKGVKTAYVTNAGFADTLSLGRQNRPDIYALQPAAMTPPVAAELCLEVDCRRDAHGQLIKPLSEDSLRALVNDIARLQPQAVAINLLFSYLNGEEEERIARALPDTLFISCSHQVLPEYKEYERGMATWLNAWLGPKVASYLNRLQQAVKPSPLGVMQSSGGTIDAGQAASRAVNLLLSGPAGGLAGAQYIGAKIDSNRLLTFDMGGTSTDVALIDGTIKLTSAGRLGDYPVAVPMVDMHTIGAGGGSLAYLDAGGLLHVGPESAGASPGPACYGQGGTQATVTDANAVLGRLRPDHFLGGRMTLDKPAAEAAVAKLANELGLGTTETALGILALANEHMAAALRVISVQKGYNPQEFELACFGGAGGLHVCALAEVLNMQRILVPANGGVLSAFGMLVAPKLRQLSHTSLQLLSTENLEAVSAQVTHHAQQLAAQGEAELTEEGNQEVVEIQVSVDCRYQGQSFCLNLPWQGTAEGLDEAFHAAHEHQFGHRLAMPVELVNVRTQVSAPCLIKPNPLWPDQSASQPLETLELPELGRTTVWLRDTLAVDQVISGPAIICETVATTLVGKGWQARCDPYGHLRLSSKD